MSAEIKQLEPAKVQYRDHTITMVHRPLVNDWSYEVQHTRTLTMTGTCPRYQAALALAKGDVDALVGKP